ncbi:hypothetical protein SBA7_460016 [Candidatus Sulfotelmatobacter sp. SbA7]|nr:hypothetical protein SBA7_460016 [Candidatus Sulfotelmatobacter sp. SbA7]
MSSTNLRTRRLCPSVQFWTAPRRPLFIEYPGLFGHRSGLQTVRDSYQGIALAMTPTHGLLTIAVYNILGSF